jgi:hypothetical protein
MVEKVLRNPRNIIFNFDEDKISNLTNTVNEILNPIFSHNELLTTIYLKLHTVIYYYGYALGSLQSFEYFLRLGQRADIQKNHAMPEVVLCSSAISAYSLMYSCIVLLEQSLSSFENDDMKKRRNQFEDCKKYIAKIRHRVSAHPGEDDTKKNKKMYLTFQLSSISYYDHNQSGCLRIRQIRIKNIEQDSEKPEMYELYPRKHFDELKLYLDDIGCLLRIKLLEYCKKYKIVIKKHPYE